MMSPARQSYSPDEIAERHGWHRATIWRAMKAGKLGYRRPFGGRQRRITLEDEQRWLAGLPPVYPQPDAPPDATGRDGKRQGTREKPRVIGLVRRDVT